MIHGTLAVVFFSPLKVQLHFAIPLILSTGARGVVPIAGREVTASIIPLGDFWVDFKPLLPYLKGKNRKDLFTPSERGGGR